MEMLTNLQIQTDLPAFVEERIAYFARYVSKGLCLIDFCLFVTAELDENLLQQMFEDMTGGSYLFCSYEFLKWYRDSLHWKDRQVYLVQECLRVYLEQA
ncbi:hypothetical protein [Enterococcus pallens]|uniref:Uncharacterized protein n=1 Tax=Enterococcus pallens ATCC BAA-351 TaxID=1158607 RepID=R2PSL9_9ENTE|nr:hypothetical protein [Enterococcus pallens]EOH86303.1 hypothetical protein UAU_05225 [Enterococcus pallens ATCC BAA-351]EOU09476.1 hypothetical protein I588_05209 [Enterococcus pallens ATCC BAA-351]